MEKETKTKLVSFVGGFVPGMLTHRTIRYFLPQPKSIEGKMIGAAGGSLIASLSYFFKDDIRRLFTAGFGSGIAASDIVQYIMEEKGVRPLSLAETDSNLMAKWIDCLESTTDHYWINPSDPIHVKEAKILPIFSKVIKNMRNKPNQITSIKRLRRELGLPQSGINIRHLYKLQQWFLLYGNYEASEGLFLGHDRFRTLSKLMRDRDRWRRFQYDCDDGAISTNQLIDSYGKPTFFLLISQKEIQKGQKVHPLHHILPCVIIGRNAFAVETIPQRENGVYIRKTLPIVPLKHIGSIFNRLKRAGIVRPDGSFFDYNGWKHQQIKTRRNVRQPNYRYINRTAERLSRLRRTRG